MDNTTLINDYMIGTCHSWDDSQKYACAVWVRANNEWKISQTYDDPYDAVWSSLPLIDADAPFVLEMFGKMTKVDADTQEPVTGEEAEKYRVRIAFTYRNGQATGGIQKSGETEFFVDDEMEGMFLDFLTNARKVAAGKV